MEEWEQERQLGQKKNGPWTFVERMGPVNKARMELNVHGGTMFGGLLRDWIHVCMSRSHIGSVL